ncbi:hypothetical protein SAMN05421595_2760 [Austwickia chelonae]|nr:hypothetical protein SAMN05421595_2760 [Austwickia chelonae]
MPGRPDECHDRLTPQEKEALCHAARSLTSLRGGVVQRLLNQLAILKIPVMMSRKKLMTSKSVLTQLKTQRRPRLLRLRTPSS